MSRRFRLAISQHPGSMQRKFELLRGDLVVAERLGHPADTALTLGRAAAGFCTRIKATTIGREDRKAEREAEVGRMIGEYVTVPGLLLGQTIRVVPTGTTCRGN